MNLVRYGTTWSLHSMMMPLHMTFHKACVLEATEWGLPVRKNTRPVHSPKQTMLCRRFEVVSRAPGARSDSFTSVRTQRSQTNPCHGPSCDTQGCSGRYSVRTDEAVLHARLAVHQGEPGWAFFGWSGVEDTEYRTVGQMSPGRISHRQGHGGTTRRVFPPGVRSVSPMHARVHARPSPHTGSREVRAQVEQARANFTLNTAHCCYSPQRRYHGPEHRERRREHSTIIRGSGRDVTAIAPRLGGEPGCGSDVSGPVSSTRYSAICRPGGLQPCEWILCSITHGCGPQVSMRPFQKWRISLRIPSSQGSREVYVASACARAPLPWRRVAFLSQGARVGIIHTLKVLTTDAGLTGWGAVLKGRTARGHGVPPSGPCTSTIWG